MLKSTIKTLFPWLVRAKQKRAVKKRGKEDLNNYLENWIYSKDDKIRNGYKIILDEHAIEKGMTNKNPRYFGIKKVENIMNCLKKYEDKSWEKDYAYQVGVGILHQYCKFYEKHNWTNRQEYQEVKKFISNKKETIKTGVETIYKKEFINQALIDYDKFISSRHSFREFENKKISDKDMEDAIKMASKTPTACNRQMIKFYYVKSDSMKEKIIGFSHGLTGFNNESVNLVVVTYDMSSLCNEGEIMQGYFNAGLASMNFVNALHSMGIGSCFLEYANDLNEERDMKNKMDIPTNEKIAVVIAAGYYPEKSTTPISTRKPIEEIYRVR